MSRSTPPRRWSGSSPTIWTPWRTSSGSGPSSPRAWRPPWSRGRLWEPSPSRAATPSTARWTCWPTRTWLSPVCWSSAGTCWTSSTSQPFGSFWGPPAAPPGYLQVQAAQQLQPPSGRPEERLQRIPGQTTVNSTEETRSDFPAPRLFCFYSSSIPAASRTRAHSARDRNAVPYSRQQARGMSSGSTSRSGSPM